MNQGKIAGEFSVHFVDPILRLCLTAQAGHAAVGAYQMVFLFEYYFEI